MEQKSIRERVIHHPVVSFFLLAYMISWLGFLPSILDIDESFGGLNLLVAQFGPAIAGGLIIWYTGGPIREWVGSIIHWRVPLKWWIITLVFPIFVFGATSLGFILLGYEPLLSKLPDPVLTFIPTLIGLSLLAGLGEEPGWRGFALPRLQEQYGPLNATFLLGILWAFWHIPVFFVDPRSSHGITDPIILGGLVLLTAVGIVLYTFFYTWIFNHTGSVLLMMLLHGGFNTATIHLVPFADEIVFGPNYTNLLIIQVGVLLISVIILITMTRGFLGYGSKDISNFTRKS
ncbi:Abortive infection protein [Methanohalobium evestigatum Z-7303]|uniref:Abortive infection protein n=1 Tax=Methanohalobium evestigatum (strain ATCC BAA-1072 / DSM 3721 / NBRC 107634 / OCM 161 / Z-7303) TaxID=644295 RepID=D7E7L8_METEZ|nr:CPBP family intramembrane glutamic endopeptidase [Methanohalobium evestigatum]ADI74091.1 Abortive infection protein [Methanohalobium evestigatum Z-7303]